MAKIESVRDLPEWFDLNKYQDCESFGAREWYEQLMHRKWVETILNQPDVGQESLGQMPEDDFVIHLRLNPIYRSGSEPYFITRNPSPIAEVRTIDLWLQARNDESHQNRGDTGALLYDRWRWIADPKANGLDFHEDLFYEPVKITHIYPHYTTRPCIMVELSASDSVLKKAFSDWLKGERNSLAGSVGKPKNPIYNKWARYGLLPYLDLRLWEMQTGNTIPDRVMSSALSRNGYDAGEANIRKTLAPLAGDLMRDLSALQVLAAIEDEEKSEPETFQD